MVLMASKLSSGIYEMLNDQSEFVGEIRRPVEQPVVGFGRGTVYLDRPMQAIRANDAAA